jgi:glycosyltransferase involved in cell wall biosynthesis
MKYRLILKVFPKISDKVTTIENIISVDFINKQANEPITDAHFFVKAHQLCFLSIGRFSYPKNFDNIPFIAKCLKEIEVDFKWFIIGFGGDEELIRKNILLAKVEKEVIILGKKKILIPILKRAIFTFSLLGLKDKRLL